MIYRPQFAYPTPPGCHDESFVYSFDSSNVPSLNSDINGLTLPYLQLPTDQDAPFYWRAYQCGPLRVIISGATSSYILPNYQVYFRDPFDNDLMDTYCQAAHTAFGMNPLQFDSGQYTMPPVPIPEIYCPAGSVIQGFIKVPTLDASLGQTYSTSLSLFGVKRYMECAK